MTGGDITRATFEATRHFSGVRMQQGRVQLDADWNEQVDIAAHRERAELYDVIGPSGAPKVGGGFGLAVTADGTDLTVSPGRLYVDGVLCEVESGAVVATDLAADGVTVAEVVVDGRQLAEHDWVEVSAAAGGPLVARLSHVDVAGRRLSFAGAVDPTSLTAPLSLRRVPTYTTQVDHPAPELTAQPNPAAARTLALPDGAYLAYVDVWERTVTALEAPAIREVALGGPDTAIRTRTVAQVRLVALATAPDPEDPGAAVGEWDRVTAAPGGLMAAYAEAEDPEDTPCVLPPSGGFQGLENQLYRVQILDGGRFLWSRENASVTAGWAASDGDRLTLAYAAQDRALGFGPGDRVELTDDTRELAGLAGTLAQLVKVEGDTLTVDPATATGSVDIADFPAGPKVRRWDSPGPVPLDRDTPIELESGIRVVFPTGGDYRTGDHWLIPARTGVPDVEWPRDSSGHPLAVAPHGIRHRYARLALLVVDAGAITVTDWRPAFPALTELTADGVAFDNSTCALPDADTVQDALERLCQERDLRYHNRHLHGWGIVCGLALRCGPNPDGDNRRVVTVQPGYAIDAEGVDLNVDADIPVDVLDRVDQLKQNGVEVLDAGGNGELCLILDRDSQPDPIRAEKFDPAQEDRSLLAGTLLLDFYNDCVKPVHDFLRTELSGDDTQPAGPVQQRRAALINLANQAVNPKSGQQVFISQREDKIIRGFYTGLRALLTSETFCAMFDNAREMPDYPLGKIAMDTIFGTGGHSRLRLHPGGKEAYTFGPGGSPLAPKAQINRYDLGKGVLAAVIDPVAGTQRTSLEQPADSTDTGTGAVTDVAFSPDGKRIHVAIASRNEDNTIFRTGTVTAGGIQWTPQVTICGMKLVSLATTAADPKVVYAVGLHKVQVDVPDGKSNVLQKKFQWQGLGLFRINPDQIDPNNVPSVALGATFSPSGPLVIDAAGRAVLAGTVPNADATSYTKLLQLTLPQGAVGWTVDLPSAGSDGIAFVTVKEGVTPNAVYAVMTSSGAAKAIVGYRMTDGGALVPNPIEVSQTGVGLAGTGTVLLVSEFDRNSVRMIDPAQDAFVSGFQLPTQVAPAAIAATPAGQVVVLNQVSDTLTVIAPPIISAKFVFPAADLVDYRAQMLDAFADLLGGFLQYLKDCLCDHFLVRCPEPTGAEEIRLGCVSIRGGQVYKICNFSGRKYVKSFPTMGYWLSLVPVQPLIARAVEIFCCTVLPEFFSRVSVPGSGQAADVGDDRLSMTSLLRLIEVAQTNDLLGSIRDLRSRAGIATRTAVSAMRALAPTVPPPGGPRVPSSTIVGQPADQVAEALRERGVTVRRARFDPRPSAQTAGTVAGIFRTPQPGHEVTLCEEDGQVRFFSVADPSPLAGRVRELEAAMAAREEELKRLRGTVSTARKVLTDAEALGTRLAQAQDELGRRDAALAELRERLDALERGQPPRRRGRSAPREDGG
jgi:hypothetical protein